LLLSSFAVVSCRTQRTPEVEQITQGVQVCPGPDTLYGIDVSYYQGNINWNQVAAAGVHFAFIRVSDGLNYPDSEFQDNWDGALAAGVIRGVYQYFRPGQNAIDQANYLLSEMGPLQPGDLCPAIDVEATDGQPPSVVEAKVNDWLDHIETNLGCTPVIYTRASFWDPEVGSTAHGNYTLWVAHYGVTCPNVPSGWSDWQFHQFSSTGSVSGISGPVDENWFNGTAADLDALTVGDPVCGDGVCNGDETNATCPQDCPVCEKIPPSGRIVDDTDLCFERHGTPDYWHEENAGWQSSLIWTYCVDSGMDNHAVWHLDFDQGGIYELEAYTAAPFAQSTQAPYQVRHDGTTETIDIDQSAVDGWNHIGEFEFAAGADQWVRLEDLTGEPLSQNVQIVFDAIRLTRINPLQDGGVGPDPDGAVDEDGGVDPEPDSAVAPDSTVSDPDATLPDIDADTSRPRDGGGCSCHLTAPPSASLPTTLLLLLGLGMWVAIRRKGLHKP
jgi:lysozyme